ncbi:hypothetical protein [Niabella sp.]|uniref:hypothetical protein n=1 Tax=Niabella sp. TaxID=1962976 RepID=UPI0026068D42|nr:hypothetical protein [Niabella sp.]
MMSKKYIYNILFVCFLSVILWGLGEAFVNQNKLKYNAILVNAKVTGYSLGGRADDSYQCEFIYKGKLTKAVSSGRGISGAWNLIGMSFPALYVPNTKIFQLLTTPKAFERYDRPIPDSLKKRWQRQ